MISILLIIMVIIINSNIMMLIPIMTINHNANVMTVDMIRISRNVNCDPMLLITP